MNPHHVKLRYNGVCFRVDCVFRNKAGDKAVPLMGISYFHGHDTYRAMRAGDAVGPVDGLTIKTIAEFHKRKHAVRVVRDAYGYNIDIKDPEFI